MNLFEIASRKAYRFPSVKGDLSIEHLWQLPLQSKTGTDLDSVAQGLDDALQKAGKSSFVNTGGNPAKTELTNKLEIVKHIISVKIAESEAAREAARNAEVRERAKEVLAKRADQKLENLSDEELARLAAG